MTWREVDIRELRLLRVEYDDICSSYGSKTEARRVAHYLIKCGVKRGDVIAIFLWVPLLPPAPQHLEIF